MGYLVTHIFASLLFAQLLGLLLGWLLWGYIARQRGIEVQGLRERIADMQVMAPRMAFAGDRRATLAPAIETSGPLVEDDLTDQLTARAPIFFKDEEEKPALEAPSPLRVADDLEAEVKEARLRHFEKQVRELEAVRDRLPLLQAELNLAITGKREAEKQLEETSNALEVRVNYLLSQIRDFERAASEWDRMRDESERSSIAKDKELSAAKSLVRDLQNNQLPQKAEPAGGISALEHADLRDRYQKALKERDALAAQLETLKQGPDQDGDPAGRLLELEEAMRLKDASLVEQVAQTESLLWRVAELEPFSLAMPRMEDDLRRQESEIAGHVAMHTESSDHIRSLLNRVAELEADSARAAELQYALAERDGELHRLAESHAAEREEHEASIEHHRAALLTAEREHSDVVSALQDRVSGLEQESRRAAELEQLLTARDSEIRGLFSAIGDIQSESAALRIRIQELAPLADRTPQLQQTLTEQTHQIQVLQDSINNHQQQVKALQQALSDHASEIQRLQTAHADKDIQVESLSQRLSELEPVAAQAPELKHQLAALAERHQAERARMTVNSAQRIRRLRQSITTFKG